MFRTPFTLGAVLWLAGSAAYPCHDPSNAIANCGFSSAGVTAPWTLMTGSCAQNGSNGSSEPGNLTCDATDLGSNFAVTIFQCTDSVVASTNYGFGADVELVSGSAVTCRINVDANDANGCLGSLGSSDMSQWSPAIGSYTQSPLNDFTTDAGATAVRLQLFCFADAAFSVRIDDVFLGPDLLPVELQELSIE